MNHLRIYLDFNFKKWVAYFFNKKCFNLLSFKVPSIHLENWAIHKSSPSLSNLTTVVALDYLIESLFFSLSLCVVLIHVFLPPTPSFFISSGFHETATFISLVFSFLSTCPNHFHILFFYLRAYWFHSSCATNLLICHFLRPVALY